MTAQQLRTLIEEHEFTQAGLAALIGLSGRQMRRYLADEAAIPQHVEMAIVCLLGLCKKRSVKR